MIKIQGTTWEGELTDVWAISFLRLNGGKDWLCSFLYDDGLPGYMFRSSICTTIVEALRTLKKACNLSLVLKKPASSQALHVTESAVICDVDWQKRYCADQVLRTKRSDSKTIAKANTTKA